MSTNWRMRRSGQIRVLAQWKGDIFEHVQIGEQCAVLEKASPCADGARNRPARLKVRISSPATRIEPLSARTWPVMRRMQRGLAGAARSHDGRHSAARNIHVKPIDKSGARFTGIAQAADLDDGRFLIQ